MTLNAIEGQPGLFRDSENGQLWNIRDSVHIPPEDDLLISYQVLLETGYSENESIEMLRGELVEDHKLPPSVALGTACKVAVIYLEDKLLNPMRARGREAFGDVLKMFDHNEEEESE